MNIAILLAGGTGTRLGQDKPKQFLDLSGKMMIMYSFDALTASKLIDDVIIVADMEYRRIIEDAAITGQGGEKLIGFADPGENRQLSIYNALREIESMGLFYSTDYVIIHDSARPFCTTTLIDECINSAFSGDGAMPVLPMNDTVYLSRNGQTVEELLDRNCIYAGQAPEVFDYAKYYEANKALLPDRIYSIKGSTEPAVMAGMDISLIPGDQRNFKVTTLEDYDRALGVFKTIS